MLLIYPHSRLIECSAPRRRFSKTDLWHAYWEINKVKVWLFMLHLSFSHTKYETEFWDYLQDAWNNNGEPLDWHALHLVYV